MKHIATILVLVLLCSGCKKAIEQAQEDLVMKAMTDGQWKITNFVNNGTNISAEFSEYKFQYHSNKTVDAIKNGIVDKTGAWDRECSYKNNLCQFYKCTFSN